MFPQFYYYVDPNYNPIPRMTRSPIPSNFYKPAPIKTPGSMQQTPNPPTVEFEKAPGSPTNLGIEYTQGYLRTQIGKRMRVTFLIGTNIIQDRTGVLLNVGISYIVLRETETNAKVLCDIYSIKFVNIFD